MKVGIFSKNSKEFFSNGCNQQALFVYETINRIENVECYIITKEKDYIENINIININDNINRILFLDILICLSAKIVEINLLKTLKLNNIKIIYYNCGNEYYIFQEDIIFDSHKFIEDSSYYKYYDEFWLIPNYKKDKYFYETIYNINVKIVPYVWNNTILNKYANIAYDSDIKTIPTKYFLIMEHN